MFLLRAFLCVVTRLVFSLRYSVRVIGLETLSTERESLILPNHPAFMDPPLVVTTLWPLFHPRPTVLKGVMSGPMLGWLPKVLGALEIPDVEQRSDDARARVDGILDSVIDGLNRGQNQILWPAGRVQRDGVERLGSARGVHRILENAPNARVILVRTRGLFGSRFSYATTGEAPSLTKEIQKGIGWILLGLVFFVPRRKVTIEIEEIDRSKLDSLDRDELGQALEDIYNRDLDATPRYVPYHAFIGPRERTYPPPKRAPIINPKIIKPEIKQAITKLLEEKLESSVKGLDKADTRLVDVGLDSLDTMDVSLEIEKTYQVSMTKNPTTVGELWALAQGLGGAPEIKPPSANWLEEKREATSLKIEGETLLESFVIRARKHLGETVVADDLSGAVTYERVLVGSLLMSATFREIPEQHVGILLPASVATDIAFFAVQFAGKVPVMLNFTTGPSHMEHGLELTSTRSVVTSRAFLERTEISLEGVNWIFLEDVRASLSKAKALIALAQVKLGWGLQKKSKVHQPNSPSVILFTSGSERAPKAVPLTHGNILSNIKNLVSVYDIKRTDTILGFLPPFHSFGLSITTMVPLLGGARLVHHPDPTDAGSLAAKVGVYSVTILPGTPTLVGSMAERARPGDFESLRLIFVGAEKCPDSLFDRLMNAAPQAHILEGYGITECSPLISANRPEDQKRGSVGLAMPEVKSHVVDPDSLEPVPRQQRGLLLVSGPSIFHGYHGDDVPDPFVEAEGNRWYNTGDLVRIDEEGFIFFEGRMKRFLKVGGEMVSLPALEEPFSRRYPPDDEGSQVAVEGIEVEGRSKIVLFKKVDLELDLEQVRQILHEEGFRGVFKIDEVRDVPLIPLLGTGKTDYKSLRAQLVSKTS